MWGDERFVEWLATHRNTDKHGNTYQYHPRSDAHSKALCRFVLDDVVKSCPTLQAHARDRKVGYGINLTYQWPSGKGKNLDLAIGTPADPLLGEFASGIIEVKSLRQVLVSCEAKTVMTEHSKSQPRIFDELSSSHEIVHQGSDQAIAAGITVVNISARFISPTRNQRPGPDLRESKHKQPHVAMRMVKHLRELKIREHEREVGFDAYCTFVVDCDNMGHARLWTDPPAPQPGEKDHYETFIRRIATSYTDRFSSLP